MADGTDDRAPSAMLSLRVDLLQRAAAAAARARTSRSRGDVRAAALLEQRAAGLMSAARSVEVPRPEVS